MRKGEEEVDYAVVVAPRALNGKWKNTTLVEGSRIIRRIVVLILERQEELAHLES